MGHLVRMVDVGLRYERIWRAAVGLLAGIGVLTALVFVSPATNLAAFLVAAFTIGAVCLSIGLGRDLPNADLLRAVPRGAVLGGLCVLAVCGYAAAVGTSTLVLLLLVLGVSPPVVSWLRSGSTPSEPAWTNPGGPGRAGAAWGTAGRTGTPWGSLSRGGTSGRSSWGNADRADGSGRGVGPEEGSQRGEGSRSGRGAGTGPKRRGEPDQRARDHGSRRLGWLRRRRADERKLPSAPALQDQLPLPKYLTAVVRSVGELTDEELCLAWRRSFTQLERAIRPDHRQAMVDVRRAYLDELERRHPDSFTSWLASNPRAAGNPSRFFIHKADH